MMTYKDEILTGDNVEIMRKMADGSVDLTVTSPPYDDLRKYNGYSFDFEAVARELYRVTKDGGVVVWVVGDATKDGSESGNSFRQALFFLEIGFKLYDTMIYAKKNYVPLTHRRYEQQFEYMFVLTKGRPVSFNPIKIPCKRFGETNRTRHRKTGDDIAIGSGFGKDIKQTKTRPNIWFYGVGSGVSSPDKTAFQHPAIFPEKLAQDHILTWSNEGDIVLDPFGGSGTTAKMAKLNGRHFIHIDISDEYNAIARQRISEVSA